jgi:hypothetical protein
MKCAGRCVQLIVFVGAIREILKTKIYRPDKDWFCVMKTNSETGLAQENLREARISLIRNTDQ